MNYEDIKNKLKIVKLYFENQGFIVKDGLKYGCDYVLYTDSPDKVHSKYTVLLDRNQNVLNLMAVQRVTHAIRKSLIFVWFENKEIKHAKVERFILPNE